MKGKHNMTKILTSKQIDELLDLQAEYQLIKDKFEAKKLELCKDLPEGKYANSSGCIIKTKSDRQVTDYKRMISDLDINVSPYTTNKEVETVTMRNYRTSK